MEPGFRSWVEVSRRRVAANYAAVRSAVGDQVEVACVVKADAYGHGAVEVSRTLAEAGARWFAVSTAEEGVELRRAGIEGRILVMADYARLSREALEEYGLTLVVHSLEDLRELDAFAANRDIRLPYHLKVDSGMGRLGTLASAAVIADTIQSAANLEFEGLMSHFASASDYASAQTALQSRAFEALCRELCARGFLPRFRHIASTNPVAYGRRDAWHNMVRPGLALYGYISPARGDAPSRILEVEPALAWKATVISAKDVPAGARIGYGGMYTATRPMRIAVVGAGYADGLSHRLSNRGQVVAAGKLVPILGAVSMDVTTIDVTECPSIVPGSSVTLLGAEGAVTIDAQQMARIAGTISYDILCGIRARVQRVHIA